MDAKISILDELSTTGHKIYEYGFLENIKILFFL